MSNEMSYLLAEREGFECSLPSYLPGFTWYDWRNRACKRLIPGLASKYVASKWPEDSGHWMPSDSASRWIAMRITLVVSTASFLDSLASNLSCCALRRMALIFFAVMDRKGKLLTVCTLCIQGTTVLHVFYTFRSVQVSLNGSTVGQNEKPTLQIAFHSAAPVNGVPALILPVDFADTILFSWRPYATGEQNEDHSCRSGPRTARSCRSLSRSNHPAPGTADRASRRARTVPSPLHQVGSF